jgi:hypothetical protein
MTSLTASATWAFSYNGEEWEATRTPPADDNLRAAVETLIIPFGTRPAAVENYLRTWQQMQQEHGFEYTLSTPAAAVHRISEETAEIRDLYDQFEDVSIPVGELTILLAALATAMHELTP